MSTAFIVLPETLNTSDLRKLGFEIVKAQRPDRTYPHWEIRKISSGEVVLTQLKRNATFFKNFYRALYSNPSLLN